MKRRPERRREWFLVAFAASAWLFFANALASLGPDYALGGIGSNAHLAAVLGSAMFVVLVASMFRLRFTRFAAAAAGGFGIASLAQLTGIVMVAASGMLWVECEAGEGGACASLADYYDSGESFVAGTTDALILYQRACDLGGPGTQRSCEIAQRLHAPTRTVTLSTDAAMRCERGVRSACVVAAEQREEAGDLLDAYEWYARACQLTGPSDDRHACDTLMSSGFPELREVSCEVNDRLCGSSPHPYCPMRRARCDRWRSPNAGTN